MSLPAKQNIYNMYLYVYIYIYTYYNYQTNTIKYNEQNSTHYHPMSFGWNSIITFFDKLIENMEMIYSWEPWNTYLMTQGLAS